MTLDYTAKDIQVLEGLEAVRVRPGMYIGSTDQRGLHHLIYEIVDNSVDEAMAGYCDRVDIVIEEDGKIRVSDDGRGIPVDTHPTTGKSALETVMTTLHAGGKFGGGAYKVSGGLHGVGASVVNGLSSWMRVEVRRNGDIYSQEYEKGIPATELMSTPSNHEGNGKTGTTIAFFPDPSIFPSIKYDFAEIVDHFKEVAYLNKGLEIRLVSLFHQKERAGDIERTYYFDGGLASLARSLNRRHKVLQDKPFYMLKTVDSTIVEAAIQYNDGYNESVLSFANCINTQEGGTHLTGFRTALTRVINDYARKKKFLRDDQPNLAGEDVREGLTAIISVKMTDPQFEGQTKTKLGNAEVKGFVETLMGEALGQYLEEHPNESRRIIDKCATAQKARDAARKARDLVIRKNALDGSSLPGKLADCSERNPSNSEIYIVEGESAGGSAKMGRDRQFQAILPIKGKILNVERVLHQPDKILGHEEIRALITALGAGEGEEFNLEKLRYHKVIIMTDADVDGSHIRTLLLTYFFRRMEQLILGGYLYIAQPPLFRISRGKTAVYKFSEEEKERWLTETALANIKVFSKDGKVTYTGKELANILDPLKVVTSELAGLRIPLDTGAFLLMITDKHRVEFTHLQELKVVSRWIDEMGYSYDSHVDQDSKEYSLFIKDLPLKILESPAFKRCFELYPQVKKLIEGESYTVLKRDQEIGVDVPWHKLAGILENNATTTGVSIQRYKGLGEMNPDQLWETTMDPATRSMLQVTIDDAIKAHDTFTDLMGEEVAPRKQFIQAHARSVKEIDV